MPESKRHLFRHRGQRHFQFFAKAKLSNVLGMLQQDIHTLCSVSFILITKKTQKVDEKIKTRIIYYFTLDK